MTDEPGNLDDVELGVPDHHVGDVDVAALRVADLAVAGRALHTENPSRRGSPIRWLSPKGWRRSSRRRRAAEGERFPASRDEVPAAPVVKDHDRKHDQ